MEAAMTIFKERERGFEIRFAQEEELRFRATARRNHMAGLWAAKKLGLAGAESDAYAQLVVAADLDRPGSDAVFQKIASDFQSRGVSESNHQIRRMLSDFMTQAMAELNPSAP
jgi:hypothetical protein